jgi:hypothetical protein
MGGVTEFCYEHSILFLSLTLSFPYLVHPYSPNVVLNSWLRNSS